MINFNITTPTNSLLGFKPMTLRCARVEAGMHVAIRWSGGIELD